MTWQLCAGFRDDLAGGTYRLASSLHPAAWQRLLVVGMLFGSAGSARALDQNNDGASDVWQARYHITTAQLALDNSGTGLSNLAKSRFGLDPFNPASTIALTLTAVDAASLQMSWASVAGIRYQVQFTDDLPAPAWTGVGPVFTGTGATLGFTAPRPGARGFYRLVAVPSLDTDGDGLDDYEEALLGTDPNLADTDGDGIGDAYEFSNGLNPLSAADALDDSDGDGVPNAYEAANGSLAGDRTSVPTAQFVVDANLAVETATRKKTIQAALDATPTVADDPTRWTIIDVLPGAYPESVATAGRRVFLRGRCNGADVPRITGGGTCLTIDQGNCVVDGFVIGQAGTSLGVYVNPALASDNVVLVNCVIRDNYNISPYVLAASGVIVDRGKVLLAHCTLTGNSAYLGPSAKSVQVSNAQGAATIKNCILWNTFYAGQELLGPNITVQTSIVRGGQGGGIDADPLFENRTYAAWDNGVLLSAASPAINAGTVLKIGSKDIHGGPRDNRPDLGVDERNTNDTDGDGLPDGWEYRAFGSLSHTAAGDDDGDLLSNAGEFQAGTNPNSADTDGDGIPDGYEVANGLNALDSQDALADADGDRVPNIYEFHNGTRANDPNSVPVPQLFVDATIAAETATTKKTILAAVNAAPTVDADPTRWTIIQVGPGDYSDKVGLANRRVFLMGATGFDMPALKNTLDVFTADCAVDGLCIGASSTGVGVYVDLPTAADHFSLVNCIVRDCNNRAVYASGCAGLDIQHGSVNVAHCDFVGNAVAWGSSIRGARVVQGSLTLRNSILWDEQDLGQEIGGSGITIQNSFVRGGYSSNGFTNTAISVDPRFEPAPSGATRNWVRLREDSPAINAGAVIPYGKRDQTGAARLGLPDLGPKENLPADSDDDGRSNEWDLWYFGVANPDPADPATGLVDTDGDGFPDVYETANGSSPTNPASVPAATITVNPAAATETATVKKTVQAAIDALPTVTANPTARGIVRVLGGNYDEAVNITQRRVLLLGSGGPVPAVLRRPAGAGYNLQITQSGCVLNGLVIEGAERLADPNNATTADIGGGVLVGGTGAPAKFRAVNCIFRRHIGSPLRLTNTEAVLTHCTLVENYPYLQYFTSVSPAYYAYVDPAPLSSPCGLTLRNSILWNPLPGESRLGDPRANLLRSATRRFPANTYAIVAGTDSLTRFGEFGGSYLDPGVTIEGFIMTNSPAIGRAVAHGGPATDLHGEARGAAPDIGADQSVDADADHLPDAWEKHWFGDLSRSALQDFDGDGASNYAEFLAGTDPTNATTGDMVGITARVNQNRDDLGFRTDSDGDGLNDGLEIISGGNPFDADTNHDGIGDYQAFSTGLSLTSQDMDGDGISNADEKLSGTNPFLADSDGDGVPDGVDAFPLDPTRSARPTADPNDHTPPVIYLDVPANAIPVP